jgi:hypothetical protein
MSQKELIIKGVHYCTYSFDESDVLWMKVHVYPSHLTPVKTEDYLAGAIMLLEDRQFRYVSPLNI